VSLSIRFASLSLPLLSFRQPEHGIDDQQDVSVLRRQSAFIRLLALFFFALQLASHACQFLDSIRKLHDGWVLTHPLPPQPLLPAARAAARLGAPKEPRQPITHVSQSSSVPAAHARAVSPGADPKSSAAQPNGAPVTNGHVAVGQPDLLLASHLAGSDHDAPRAKQLHVQTQQGWNPARVEALNGDIAAMSREQLLRSIAALRADLVRAFVYV
jgi:hypothetical protein